MKVLKTIFIVFLILTATAGGAAWSIYNRIAPPPRPVPAPNASPELAGGVDSPDHEAAFDPIPFALGKTYILLIGLDELDGGRRADAIALGIVDWDGGLIRILSIPRDSRVYIPGRGWDKINHAYSYGGMELVRETVINLFNVDVNQFVVLNYDSFPRLIDLIGGIDINVEKKLVYTDFSGKLFINIPKGQQHMSGKTTLEYVRFRHDPLGDIGRIQRQQKVISIIADKMKSPSIITKLPDLVGEVVSAVNTDLSPGDTLQYLSFANSLGSERIKMVMTPGKASYIGNVSYWIVDIPKTISIINGEDDMENNGEWEETPPTELDQDAMRALVSRIGKIGILNGDGANGLGRQASQLFQNIGVDVVYTGNARHFDYRSSNVIYPNKATEQDKQAADALAELCGITNRALIRQDNSASMVSIIVGHDKEAVFKRLKSLQF